ncbi:MAG: hypothetical protein JNL70_01705 [Saprospiraceae bacterium]|nr:hypothetical protein [Saprospiraceae bacterium]
MIDTTKIKEPTLVKILIALFFAIGCWVIARFDGTGDTGDSITHYFYARYAVVHPDLFFHHWAKPLFVLLASPFAQFGFNGIKFFNLINATLTLWLTYQLAKRLDLRHPFVAVLILATCSGYFTLTFSGLTEHLFALLLVWAILELHTEGYLLGSVLISFLPFVRSEGLLMVGLVGLYLLSQKQWKMLPFLTVGHLVYGLAGAMVHGSVFWIFTKIPYATLNAYGHGGLFDFFEKLYYMTGLPQFILWVLGVVSVVFILKKRTPQYKSLLILVYGCFFALFIAHSLFWYFGVFMSMGLSRVLNAVMPLFALIGLCGFNFLATFITNEKGKTILKTVFISLLLIFPLTSNPAAINPKRKLMAENNQVVARQIAEVLKAKYPYHIYYLLHPQIALSLDLDYFDDTQVRDFGKYGQQPLPPNAILIWDSWFCVVDAGIPLEKVEKDTRLEKIEDVKAEKDWRFVVFKVKGPPQ